MDPFQLFSVLLIVLEEPYKILARSKWCYEEFSFVSCVCVRIRNHGCRSIGSSTRASLQRSRVYFCFRDSSVTLPDYCCCTTQITTKTNTSRQFEKKQKIKHNPNKSISKNWMLSSFSRCFYSDFVLFYIFCSQQKK